MFKRFGLILIPLILSSQGFSQEEKSTGKTNIISTPATITYKRKTPPAQSTTAPANEPNNSATTKSPPLNNDIQSSKPISNKNENKPDTIIKLGGKKIICDVHKINPTTVSYSKIYQSEVLEMPRKDIEKIYFRNGRKEILNKPVLRMIDQTQWEAVLVTENPAEVEGLYQRGALRANASSGSRSPKAAKTSATIRLQKKAANLGALIVLITHSEMKGGYGEIPGWELEGIAYSDTPPADTAAVNKAIRLMMKKNRERVEGAKKKNK